MSENGAMIDAREQVGTPVITDCPNYVTFDGKTYEIAADAFAFKPGPITFEADQSGSLFDKLRGYAAFPTRPTDRFTIHHA